MFNFINKHIKNLIEYTNSLNSDLFLRKKERIPNAKVQ